MIMGLRVPFAAVAALLVPAACSQPAEARDSAAPVSAASAAATSPVPTIMRERAVFAAG